MPFSDLLEAQRCTQQQIAVLTEAQRQANYRLNTLTNDMAEVKDILFELRYRNRAHAYFAPLIRRTRVLSPEEIDRLLGAAVTRGHFPKPKPMKLSSPIFCCGGDVVRTTQTCM